jgi:plasmid replication initiation protein
MKKTIIGNAKDMGTVVKTNRLNMAIQNLSLAEIRLIQLAIIDAREYGKGIDTVTPLAIHASRYSEAFNVSRHAAYDAMINAEANLFKRYFTFLDEVDGLPIKSTWISQVKYNKKNAIIEIIFAPAVVREITRIDGIEKFFSQYALEQIAEMTSMYSIRLYELLNQWKTAKKTPVFKLETFRGQMGVGVSEYKRMSDFKRRVLDLAVNEVNEKSDLRVSYEQEKQGAIIIGFKFKVVENKKTAIKKSMEQRDEDVADMFIVDNLSDKQLGRIVRNPSFMADYNHLVSPTSLAGQSQQGWEFEMLNRIKKDASQFSKRPIRDYLEY